MRLTVRLDPHHRRRWHLDLVRRLAGRAQTEVTVEWTGRTDSSPAALALVCALERAMYGLALDDALAAVEMADFTPFVDRRTDAADLVIDLTGERPRTSEPTWHVTFDGAAGEGAAIGALIGSRTPVVAVVDAMTGAELVSGHPGVENS